MAKKTILSAAHGLLPTHHPPPPPDQRIGRWLGPPVINPLSSFSPDHGRFAEEVELHRAVGQ